MRRKVWVIPTPFLPKSIERANLTRVEEAAKKNLRLLKDNQARIAFGSDAYGSTPVEYVNYIASLGVFSNLEMLKIWCERTPQTIFPNRKIGRLKENYEASFIVLGGNPLENFGQVKNIKSKFKQGYILTP
ncbi:MAG TPA: hypothetical protein VF692_04895 [Pyrinomonadaceae bacterium]